MRTLKVVVIGASGVGKTSFRNQYISGRFTTGYRATIGADFITKTVPHHDRPEEKVTLQIWDTAGQERFSSLSSAFFRGADAVILMFDVNQPSTLEALSKWWNEFKDRAPVRDEDMDKFCCIFVGNKIDIPPPHNASTTSLGRSSRVDVAQAARFIDTLIPPPLSLFPPPPVDNLESMRISPFPDVESDATFNIITPSPHTHSIDISIYRRRKDSRSRSRTRSMLYHSGTIGTMTTTHSISEYHTPRSSIFDAFESARSSPIPRSTYSSRTNLRAFSSSPSSSPSRSRSHSPVQSLRRQRSISSTYSDAQTITPSLFVRKQDAAIDTACTTPSPGQSAPALPILDQGTKLFFTSAKTGEGVVDVFEYLAKRVVTRWEYEESIEARTLHMAEASIDGTIRLHNDNRRWNASTCCGS
ncbi:ras-domain-containing protein [Trametopsis cervina]|nr:ras-domain-containing protein [Trametopsis cervina]